MAKSKLTLIERLTNLVLPCPMSGCWLWAGFCDRDGYGTLTFNGQFLRAHRAMFEIYRRPIPADLQIDHLCRVRCCVNPDHLEVVSLQENLRRGLGNAAAIVAAADKRRAIAHCPQGHLYSPENTYVSKTGRRHCWACLTARDLASRESRRVYHAARHKRLLAEKLASA